MAVESPIGWIVLKYIVRLRVSPQVACAVIHKVSMSKKLIAETAAAPESFEQAMAELAQLVSQMESGELPLEASVAAYARGSELVKFCAAQLEKVESQVKVLEGDMLRPFAAEGAGEGMQ